MKRLGVIGRVLVVVLAATALMFGLFRTGLFPDRYNPLLPLDLSHPPDAMTDVKLWFMANDTQACVAALGRVGIRVKELPFRSAQPGCAREGTVAVKNLSQAAIGEEEMRCGLALRLYLLERHVIQPLAQKHFGSAVTEITHFGSYSCRTIRGSLWRMSEHATANAFDISGMKFADGRLVSLKRHWTTSGASARFLRGVRAGACDLFNMVLSPDFNADHADHFHVDLGLFRGCH